MDKKRFYDFNTYLRNIFGCRVQKITIDANLTCPNRDGTKGFGGCIYCNKRGSGTGLGAELSVSEQILRAKDNLKKRYKAKKFLAYFQSYSNTYGPIDKLKSLYMEALSIDDIVGISIGTRPDCVEDGVLDYLKEVSNNYLVWLEYGLQSAHNKTLELINRGHGIEEFIDAVKRTRQRGLNVCVHVILGLPYETRNHMLETARFLSNLDIQGVKIHLLYIIKDTPLEKWYLSGKYNPLTREEYVDIVSHFISYLPDSVVIQRITGDPHREELVAPMWALEKQKNINAILDFMERHNLYQGKYFKGEIK
ncbi:TIGR01212 family radical SAM protein [Desulfothermus okinawensis JCM 13304]